MRVLILGSGGREHALAWKLKQSKNCEELFVAPGNGGTSQIARNLPVKVNDFNAVKNAIVENRIDLLVVGPEDPLVNGVVDFLKSQDELTELLIIGPSGEGALLEGSKDFSKKFMEKYGIPTAKARVFTIKTLSEGVAFLESISGPYVLKADGLAAGKGVIITEDLAEAKANLTEMLKGKFGAASSSVLIEEYLSGIEVSVFVITDGRNYKILPEAKDYKRIGEGDTGPNTGGMGAISPVIFANRIFMEKVEERIIKPTIRGISEEGFEYKGFIFFGLIKVNGNPFVIEYNVRMGDPEAEVVMPRIKSDLLDILTATARGHLHKTDLQIEPYTASTVMLVSEGYPGSYEKGREMTIGEPLKNVVTFHAGTAYENSSLKTNGGRVLAITGLGKNMDEALNKSYQAIRKISWEGMTFRKDIGFDLKRLGQ